MKYQFEFTCPLPHGLHARPASWLEREVNNFDTEIILTNQSNGKQANAKSVLSLIAANIRLNDICTVAVDDCGEGTIVKLKSLFCDNLIGADTPIKSCQESDAEIKLNPSLRHLGIDFLPGQAIVAGIGIGKAIFIDNCDFPEVINQSGKVDAVCEQEKVINAFDELKIQLRNTSSDNHEVQSIMDTHLSILNDVEFFNQIKSLIFENNLSAANAIKQTAEFFCKALSETGNSILAERSLDINDVSSQLIRAIYGDNCIESELMLSEPSICIARNMTPTEFLKLDRKYLKGLILTEATGTSHTVIIARSYGIATVAVAKVPALVANRQIIVDGTIGIVVENPTTEIIEYYNRQVETEVSRQKAIRQAIETSPGFNGNMEIAANAINIHEIETALSSGAQGIGVLRTEILFAQEQTAPSESQQFEIYKTAANLAGEKKLIIRTLDIGGDKPLPFMPLPAEENPFLGYRAVRIYKEYETFFREQLAAIIKASAFGNVHLMVPMICSVEEIRWVNKIILEIQDELGNQNIPFNKTMPVGIMIEVPSTAFIIDQLAVECDFFSIGTNDLAQYFLAADRGNEYVKDIYTPAHPSFIRLLKKIVDDVHEAKRWVGICGEMASQLEFLPLLIGIGFDELSLSFASIPAITAETKNCDPDKCRELLDCVCDCTSIAGVRQQLNDFRHINCAMPIVHETLVITDSGAKDKHQAIKTLVDQIYINGRTENPVGLENAIWDREGIYSTGFGFGIAIPHCKSKHVLTNSIAVLRLSKPIDWNSSDGQPVNIVILLAINDSDAAKEHMKIFAKLSRKIMHEDFRDNLLNIAKPENLINYIKEHLEL
ncbi:MAG: phosphoenolpyruvate--protein phosphotransferase [Phycisphaerae bacterium]|nr:phosphoenolpyruvate--protein phosphotransferase [Phycisphaerae bacterium]